MNRSGFWLCAAVFLSSSFAFAQSTFTTIDHPGGTCTRALGINNSGQTMLYCGPSLNAPDSLSTSAQALTTHVFQVTTTRGLGGSVSFGFGINDHGWVTGDSNLPDDQSEHGFVWAWRQGTVMDIGTLGGPNASSPGPSKDGFGRVMGHSLTGQVDPNHEIFCPFTYPVNDQQCLPYTWQNGVISALPVLGGNNGNAYAMNRHGTVAGIAENSTKDSSCVAPQVLDYDAARWDSTGQVHKLPALPGDTVGAAIGVNDQDTVVGCTGPCAPVGLGCTHAVVWRNGVPSDLGSLGGVTGNVAGAINDVGQIVGNSDLPGDATTHAFLWQNGVMSDLGTLPGDTYSFGLAINAQRTIVGYSCDASFNCRAFIWRNGTMKDLNNLVPAGSVYLNGAFDINDEGDITGVATDLNTGILYAFVLSNEQGSNTDADATVSVKPSLPASVRQIMKRPWYTHRRY